MKGVPVRVEIGPKDVQKNQIVVVRRDIKDKQFIPIDNAGDVIVTLLETIQKDMFNRALEFRNQNTFPVANYEEFKKIIDDGGFVKAFWAGSAADEAKIKEDTKATIRCIPLNQTEKGICFFTGKPSDTIAIFARAY